MANTATDTATLSERVAEEIRALLARKRMSGRKLAEELNVSPSWVSYRLTGAQPIDLNDLERFARALDVEIADLFPRSQSRLTDSNFAPVGTHRPVNAGSSRPAETTRPPGRTNHHSPHDATRRPARTAHAHTH